MLPGNTVSLRVRLDEVWMSPSLLISLINPVFLNLTDVDREEHKELQHFSRSSALPETYTCTWTRFLTCGITWLKWRNTSVTQQRALRQLNCTSMWREILLGRSQAVKQLAQQNRSYFFSTEVNARSIQVSLLEKYIDQKYMIIQWKMCISE